MKMSLKWCCQNLPLPRNCRDIKLAINQILVTIIAEVGMTLLNSKALLEVWDGTDFFISQQRSNSCRNFTIQLIGSICNCLGNEIPIIVSAHKAKICNVSQRLGSWKKTCLRWWWCQILVELLEFEGYQLPTVKKSRVTFLDS